MTLADDAAAALPQLVRLAEDHRPALNKAFQLINAGALVGPAEMELFDWLSWRHRSALRGFDDAYYAIRQLASTAAVPLQVAAPRLPGMPSPPAQHGGDRGGDPVLLDQLTTELSRAGIAFEDAGNSVVSMLNRLGLDAGPGYCISRNGGWLDDRRRDLQRRRAQLLATDNVNSSQPGVRQPPKGKPSKSSGPWWSPTHWSNLYLHHFLPGVWGSVKQAGLSAAATNPASAVVYMAVDWNGWKKHGAPGMISGAEYAVHHPGKAFEAIINLEEWKKDPVKAWGELAPDVVVTAMTFGSGGSAAAGRRTQQAAARLAGLRRLAKLRRIAAVEKAGQSLETTAKSVGRIRAFDKTKVSRAVPSDSVFSDVPTARPAATRPDGSWAPIRNPAPGVRDFVHVHRDNASQRLFSRLFPQLENINPNYASRAWGYRNNCQACVVVTDHLLAGGDPLSAIGRHPRHRFPWPKTVIDQVAPGKSFQPINGYPEIIREMASAGDGARGIVHGMRLDPQTGLYESGHVFNAVNRSGRVYFLDGQIGGWAYLEKYDEFEFLRIK